MDNDEKDNKQQRKKSSRTTAGKDTRKKYADDTDLQQQLARTPTKGSREAIQCDTITSEVSGHDMENGKVMTGLELACIRVRSRTSGLHNDKGNIKFKNNMDMWSILSGYLSMYNSSNVSVLIYIIHFVRTNSVV